VGILVTLPSYEMCMLSVLSFILCLFVFLAGVSIYDCFTDIRFTVLYLNVFCNVSYCKTLNLHEHLIFANLVKSRN